MGRDRDRPNDGPPNLSRSEREFYAIFSGLLEDSYHAEYLGSVNYHSERHEWSRSEERSNQYFDERTHPPLRKPYPSAQPSSLYVSDRREDSYPIQIPPAPQSPYVPHPSRGPSYSQPLYMPNVREGPLPSHSDERMQRIINGVRYVAPW